jgi:hypothetical protein
MVRLRRAINKRMEEMSFRSGAFAVIGALAAAGLMIALIVTLGGHSAASANASGPGAGVRSVAPSSSAAFASAAVPASPSARAKATAKTRRTTTAQNYAVPAQPAAVPAATPSQALPAAAYPHPHHPKRPTLGQSHAPPSFPIFWFPGL